MLKDKSENIKKIDGNASLNPSIVTSALSGAYKIERSKLSYKIERSAQNTQEPCFIGN